MSAHAARQRAGRRIHLQPAGQPLRADFHMIRERALARRFIA